MDQRNSASPGNITVSALIVESGLAAVALAICWAIDLPPLYTDAGLIQLDHVPALLVGILAALPLFAALVVSDRMEFRCLAGLRAIVRDQVVPLFRDTSLAEFLAISLSAGIGEELMFRALFQGLLTDWWGPGIGTWSALAAASALFGLCHWLSASYAIVATFMGLILGGLYWATGNIIAAIAMHAVYDVLALLYLARGTTTAAMPSDQA